MSLIRTRCEELQDGRRVEVKELTIAEIRSWLAELTERLERSFDEEAASEPVDLVDEHLLEDMTLDDLVRMTSLDHDGINELSQSAIDQIAATARELNPHFFGMRRRLLARSGEVRSASVATN
ncbi:hypothetical protein SR882_10270 [Guyparkeria halophila]|uniref:Uncharacterized protein n=1 Tax=Guyparkeria halophila TaxID=47960 RepID=A0ABZ0YVD6_9GAMM|nr:hypothetical protein [Guyparkeria halophila]WQH16135.1 hypothetical protein SR882_10270 [Guyparkeria halophila]